MVAIVDISSYGAVLDGVTYCDAAFNAAWATGAGIVTMGAGQARIANPLTIPGGKELRGWATNHYLSPGFSSTVICDNGVLEPVILNGGGGSLPTTLRGIDITRAGTTIPVSSKGFVVRNSDHVVIEDVQTHHHAIGYQIESQLRMSLTRVCTFDIAYTHANLIGAPEISLFDCRFGRNGGSGAVATNYIRVTGNVDTLKVKACTFSDPNGLVSAAFLFDSYANVNGVFLIEGNHFEQATNFLVTNNCSKIQRILLAGNSINVPGNLIAGVDDPTSDFQEMTWSGNNFGGAAPACFPGINGAVVGNNFKGPVVVNGGFVTFTGNTLQNDLTINGCFSRGAIVGNAISGVVNDCGSGSYVVNGNSHA